MDNSKDLKSLYRALEKIGSCITPGRHPNGFSQEEKDAWLFVQKSIAADEDLKERFIFPFSPTLEDEEAKYPHGKRGADGMRDGQWFQRISQYLIFQRRVLDDPPEPSAFEDQRQTVLAELARVSELIANFPQPPLMRGHNQPLVGITLYPADKKLRDVAQSVTQAELELIAHESDPGTRVAALSRARNQIISLAQKVADQSPGAVLGVVYAESWDAHSKFLNVLHEALISAADSIQLLIHWC